MTSHLSFHVYYGPDGESARPVIRRLGVGDCFAALAEGLDDFLAMPSHLVFLGLFYVVAGMALASLSSFGAFLHLVFPLAAGFALVGPVFAIGLYEMSRRRELGLDATWRDAFAVLRSPALPAILALGLLLVAWFAAWIGVAEVLYVRLYGPDPPAAAASFLQDALTSERGRTLIVLGCGLGFGFAAVALCVSVVSFPLLLDRDVGLFPAIATSLRLARESPLAVATWGAIVAGLLIVGSLPLFIGLAIVMPVLGHATWRFYRRAVQRDPARERPVEWPSEPFGRPASFHATAHSLLFPVSAQDPDSGGPKPGEGRRSAG